MKEINFPLAVEAPEDNVVELTAAMLEQTMGLSRKTSRGRIIQRLHKTDESPLHRMLNAMQPGTYIRPHRHLEPPKSEVFVILKGAVRFVEFSDSGDVIRWMDMRAGSEVFGVDIEPGVWHALIALEPDSAIFEVKNGPYTQTSDKDFPDWAPAEGTPEAQEYLKKVTERTGKLS